VALFELPDPRFADPNNIGALMFRDLGDGRGMWLYRMLFTFKIVIGPIGSPCFADGWCYKKLDNALSAFILWDPKTEKEPKDWTRHPASGRYRYDHYEDGDE